MTTKRYKPRQRVYLDKRGSYILAPDGVERLPTDKLGLLTEDEWREADALVAEQFKRRARITSEYLERRDMVLDCRDLPEETPYNVIMDRRFAEIGDTQVPMVSKDFQLSQKEIEHSRTSWEGCHWFVESATRRVAEAVEDLVVDAPLGDEVVFQDPRADSWKPVETIRDTLAAVDRLRERQAWGPFALRHGIGWDRFLDNDYYHEGVNLGTITLRSRLQQIEAVEKVVASDQLGEFQVLLVEEHSHVVRLIVFLLPTLEQVDEETFRVVAQIAPQVRCPDGIVRGVIAQEVT